MIDLLQQGVDHLYKIFITNLDAFVVVGLFGQFLFMSRFLVQWVASEKAGRSVIPVAFWYLSVAGAAVTLIYALYRGDPVFVLAQLFGSIVYIRNLMLISKNKSKALLVEGEATDEAKTPAEPSG